MKLSILFPPNTCIYKTRTKKLLTKGHISAQRRARAGASSGPAFHPCCSAPQVSALAEATAAACAAIASAKSVLSIRISVFSLFDEVAGVHQTLDHFTRYSKAQIALHPRSNHTGEGALRRAHRLNRCHLHKLNVGPWIRFFRRRFT